eukprot:TRINITY_DN75901_c0_g1_i1.p1 TRINITY_DN75901_c0_g1~~TRINITY_DN75901_c0_g1_i1.p1  ORF type:complete len:469 (-),score=57.07 TRINITY_DN75901_c0_g1_i1:480-1886(-)
MLELVAEWWPLLLGNVLEWYEFGVYGFLAKEMEHNFFPGSRLATWVGFSVTFIMRPIGGALLGRLADRAGRRTAVLASFTGMLIATVSQGLLPTYRCCGDEWGSFGLIALVILRAMQGLCAGGEIGCITTYCCETAPAGKLLQGASLVPATGAISFAIASGSVALLVEVFGQENMLNWGWRIPYLVSLFPGLVALWGRSRLKESPQFRQAQDAEAESLPDVEADPSLQRRPLLELVTHHKSGLLVGFLVTVGYAVTFYLNVWSASYINDLGLDQRLSLLVVCASMLIGCMIVVLSGKAADAYLNSDPLALALLGTSAVAALGWLVFLQLSMNPGNAAVAFVCLAVVYPCMLSPTVLGVWVYVLQLFPTRVRAIGYGLSANLAVAYLGGSASVVATGLVKYSNAAAPGCYLSGCALLSVVVMLIARPLHRKGRLERYALGACKLSCSEVKQLATCHGKASTPDNKTLEI